MDPAYIIPCPNLEAPKTPNAKSTQLKQSRPLIDALVLNLIEYLMANKPIKRKTKSKSRHAIGASAHEIVVSVDACCKSGLAIKINGVMAQWIAQIILANMPR